MRLGRRSIGAGRRSRAGGGSCIVPAMDDDRPAPEQFDPSRPGPLTREAAIGLLARADDLLHAGEYQAAAANYVRVVGFDDPAVTAAALLGLGEARYRLDDEDGAVANWEAVVKLGETPSTYRAWRNLAASSVRIGDLGAAMRAYREADRRAPPEDKAEIANRLGWLAKETGDTGTAKRYFARGRGDGPLVPLTMVIIVATVIVSLVAMLTAEGSWLTEALELDKPAVAAGEYWRLWTVTLVHADPLHLFFNMYALYLVGPIVERWYGSIRFLVFYLACAAAGSAASFVFGSAPLAVGRVGGDLRAVRHRLRRGPDPPPRGPGEPRPHEPAAPADRHQHRLRVRGRRHRQRGPPRRPLRGPLAGRARSRRAASRRWRPCGCARRPARGRRRSAPPRSPRPRRRRPAG